MLRDLLSPPNLQRARRVGLTATLLAAIAFFAHRLHGHYPIHGWLFWHYALAWLVVGVWGLGCLSVGNLLLGATTGARWAITERLSLGFALGVLCFGFAIFFLGLVGGLNVVSFVLLPLAMLASGARPLRRVLKRVRRHLVRRRSLVLSRPLALRRPRLAFMRIGVVLLAALGFFLLYFQTLSPEAFSYDARWYHLPMAQRYAITGSIARFEEGFWMGAYPQLPSYLYTWALLTPGVALFTKLVIAVTLEVLLFVATLAQIPLVLRRVLPGSRVGLSWTAMLLLFPGLYLYPSNLHAGGDHIAAFWALPIALTLYRAWRHFTPQHAALFAVFLSAATLTKYTAIAIVAPAGLALLLRGVWLILTRRRKQELLAFAWLIAVPAVLTSIHWLKNLLWYGDPIYPMLAGHLPVRPWNQDTQSQIDQLAQVAKPFEPNLDGVLTALKTTLTFSFIPNNWHYFHRDWPIFGSLFTLTLPCLFFLRGTRRLWALYLLSMQGVFVWYAFNHYDRLLQVILPWMAAATAGAVILIWQNGNAVRWALVPLLALQVIWGGDVPFIRTHNLIHESPIRQSALFLASGFEGNQTRYRVYEPLNSIGSALPQDAVVLAHDVIPILGLDRNWITDVHQSKFSYGRLRTPRAIYQELSALGVTHLVWPPWSLGRDSLAGDLAFFRFAHSTATSQWNWGGYTIGVMPPEPPPEIPDPDRAAVYGCTSPYLSGWYDLDQLTRTTLDRRRSPKPRIAGVKTPEVQDKAKLVAVDTRCNRSVQLKPPLVLRVTRGHWQLWIRTP